MHDSVDEERVKQAYYESCLFALELENTAIDYLESVCNTDDVGRANAAKVLLDEHRASRDSLWGRLYCQRKASGSHSEDSGALAANITAQSASPDLGKRFDKAREYADLIDEGALEVELDQIRRFQQEGAINDEIARQLRENVHLFQMTLKR